MSGTDYDLCIIGGGINGTGIARDAAGRGLSVLLLEARDLGGATSSASSKMIHGGLRYLEHGEFRLVRESLNEREALLTIAPHIVRPMEFVIPHENTLRPAWMIRLGLFFYDHLAGRQKLRPSTRLKLRKHPYGAAVQYHYETGFTYADCCVDDARLVILNAMDASSKGAAIMTRTACTGLQSLEGGKGWRVRIRNTLTDAETSRTAAAVINAAGPWVRHVLERSGLAGPETPHIRLVKGSHIVIPRIYGGEQAWLIQQPDRRVIFVFPYGEEFNLVGTTETAYAGDPYAVSISREEEAYLCNAINRTFKTQTDPARIVWSYSGVRPLIDDKHTNVSEITRDYRLVLDRTRTAPLLSVFGGKLTTYRRLAEHALAEMYPHTKPWTTGLPLPGGDLDDGGIEGFMEKMRRRYLRMPEEIITRLAHGYGTRMENILGMAKQVTDLGRHFGGGLYEAEVRYLVTQEWARTAEDILWRRTKLGLYMNAAMAQALERALPEIHRDCGIL